MNPQSKRERERHREGNPETNVKLRKIVLGFLLFYFGFG